MELLFIGLFVGIGLGLLIERYVFRIFDIKIDVYQYKNSDIATEYYLNAESMKMEFNRKYPEYQSQKEIQQTDAIGFKYPSLDDSEDDEIYEE